MNKKRNISFSVMICFLIIMIIFSSYLIYDLTKIYYDDYKNESKSVFIEEGKKEKSINVFGYKLNIPNLKVFTDE